MATLRCITRAFVWLFSFLIGAVVLIALMLVGSNLDLGWRDNGNFAATYFDGLFDYEDVLASQKRHPWGAESWDCTYAVVSISENAPVEPGLRNRSVLGWQYAWGGNWQPTPAPELGDSTRDAIGFCSSRLPDGLGQRLQTALETEGSLFVRDGVGETVMIYAPVHGIAARIRYGD